MRKRLKRQPKFPAIYPHKKQPERAKKLNITLLRPGLMRIHFRTPRRVISTDRYRALRMMRHTLDSYLDEIGKNYNVLSQVTERNLELAEKHADIEAIKEVKENLEKVLPLLKRMRAKTKTDAIEKLKESIERLDGITEDTNGFEREKIVGPSCMQLVSFRTRYGDWRSEEISRISGSISKREDYLLFLRDEFFEEAVDYWIKVLSSDGGPIFLDAWKRDMRAQKEIFEILDMEDENVRGWLILKGRALSEKYDVAHLRRAYKLLNNGHMEQGKRFMREFTLALGTMNPLVVAGELEDHISDDILAYMQEAAVSIKNERFTNAVFCLKEIKQIRSIQTGKS